ncbi:MAG TPA: M50 family metallopeptidase [Gemmatimonadaceae bacterium]|nr:M50 family metallopeptidase [Gemmatimonadaceae bacterium]
MTPSSDRKAPPFGNWLWVAAGVALVLSLTSWGEYVLYPFKLFTTWIHETSHAITALLVGGSVDSITIARNTSGLTRSLLPPSRIAQGLVSSAGYMGAAIAGCLLIASTRVSKRTRPILIVLGALMLLTAAIWIRNGFGFGVVLAWGIALVLLARYASSDVARFVVSFLAVQVALNAVYDIRILFLIQGAPTDAASMASLFLLPAWFWAGLWMLLSLGLLAVTLRKTAVR